MVTPADLRRLAAGLRHHDEQATKGPWHSFHVDDSHAMNCYGVTTDPNFERNEDYIGGGEEHDAPCRRIVALTLYQATRVVCHEAGRWGADAALIVHARNSLPELADVLEAAADEIERLERELDHTTAAYDAVMGAALSGGGGGTGE
jgi:hypothetical protein